MSIVFGIPKRQSENKELFPDTPVLTMELVKEKGFNRRFSLNQTAVETLGIIPGVSSVIFAFNEEESKVYIAKHSTEDSLLVGKNKAFSNKRYYDFIAKVKALNESEDNYFELMNPKTLGDVTVYELVKVSLIAEEKEVSNPIIDKEIEHLVEEVPTNGYSAEESVETIESINKY